MSAERALGRLPAPVSSFVGRERQIADVTLVLSGSRLVTLTGAGGCGKTRLALAVAARLREAFSHGTVFVPLAPLGDPSFVAPSVGRALGISEGAGRSYREAVALALQDAELLLVLDNFEHLLLAAPLVTEWLAACPGLSVLATSRERLRLQGERVYAVPPLSVAAPASEREPRDGVRRSPPASHASSSAPSEAVRLFVDRAGAVQHDFALTEETAPIVAEVCRRLDGLPLAIELAASQIRLLPPAAMRARLDRRLPLLTSGPRDVPERQRTLRDTIAWSHDLLDEQEQRLFRRLSVFVGGWTLEAAERVCSGDEIDGGASSSADYLLPTGVLELVASLVDKSLVVPADPAADMPRFTMLETIREYASEQLAAVGEVSELRSRHASYYLALAEEAAPQLTGPDQLQWMASLTAAHADLRVALRWLVDQQDGETASRLLWAIGVFMWARGHIAEAGRWSEEILAGPSLTPLAEARTCGVAGMATFKQGAYPTARTLLTRALELFQELDDRQGAARAALLLGHVVPKTGEIHRAAPLLEEARAGFESIGERWGAGQALAGVAVLALMRNDRAEARRLCETYLALAQSTGDQRSIGQARDGLALVALWGDDYASAATLLQESLPDCLEAGHLEYVAYGLGSMACVAVAGGQPHRAARLLGTVSRLLAEAGVDEWPVRRDLFVGARTRARAQIGDDAFAVAYAEGRQTSAEDAVRYALTDMPVIRPASRDDALTSPVAASGGVNALDDAVPVGAIAPAPSATPSPLDAADPRQPLPGGLSKREVEVARLVAAGKTNREIATALTVSERTVTTHLDHIFTKLDVSSRTAVAAFALRNGLA